MMQVLIVEDDQRLALLIKEQVNECGYEAVCIGSALDAITWLAAHSPNLAIINCDLPDMNGQELLAVLATKKRLIPPAIITFNHDEKHMVAAMMKLGARDYIVKDRFFLEMLPGHIQRLAQEIENGALLHQAEEKLMERDNTYKAVFEGSRDAISIISAKGNFLDCNQRALELFGLQSKDEFAVCRPADFSPALQPDGRNSREASRAYVARALEKGEHVLFEWLHQRKNGETFPTEVILTAYTLGEEMVLHSTIRDITERKEAEAALRQSEGKFRYIAEFSPLPLAIIDEEGNYAYINPRFNEVFGYNLEDIPTGKQWFRLAYPDSQYRHQVIGGWLDDLQKMGGNVVRSRVFRVTCKDGSEKDIHFWPVLMDNGKQLVMGEDVTERLKAEKEIFNRNLELTTLYNLSTHMRTAKTSAELLPIALDETCRLLHVEDGAVLLLEPQQQGLTVNAGSGSWAGMRGTNVPLNQDCASIVLTGGNPYVSQHYSLDILALPLAEDIQTGPAVLVPLQSQDKILGMLVLHRRTNNPFATAEVKLLTAIGDMAGNALHRQQLHENAQQRMERLQALRKIDMAITGNLDLYSTLQITLAQATETLNIDAAAIIQLDPDKTLRYKFWKGFCNANPGQIKLNPEEQAAHTRIWESAISQKRPYFISSLPQVGSKIKQHSLTQAEGFVAYGAVPLVTREEVQGVLEVFHRKPLYPDEDWLKFLETLAGQTAIAIDNDRLFTTLERVNLELSLAYEATIEGWAHALDLRDKETEGHSQRVMEMTVKLALAMDIPEDELLHIRRGALLHDIGKMGIPDAILFKPGKLTDEEWEIMRRHPQYAWEMLHLIEYLRPALQIPYCHHEKWDGSGYPRGLGGEEIPLEARIFALVDVYDALTSDRPYRPAWSQEQTLDLIRGERGRHFDPRVVELFLDNYENLICTHKNIL